MDTIIIIVAVIGLVLFIAYGVSCAKAASEWDVQVRLNKLAR